MTRRALLRRAGTFGLGLATERLVYRHARAGAKSVTSPGPASTPLPNHGIDLVLGEHAFRANGRTGTAMTINGTVPGPIIRLREGQEAVIRVTNRLKESSSIHWHGLIVPPEMDGVPGVSFAGIRPGETFTYRFPVKQSGTYWAHSHSGGQELLGIYAPLLIDPMEPEPFQYDRDHVVLLSDWSFESPGHIIDRLKKQGGYYNYQKRLLEEAFSDWSRMRMDPTDIADVTGATNVYLMNGLTSASGWSGTFAAGERVRLRFINAGASTYFDVRIPGLPLTLVQADGQNVQPVVMDEFRIAPAETYDVIVSPAEARAYTVFAETMDRSGFACGTLTPRAGLSAAVPARRTRPLRTMADMGMTMGGMKAGDGKGMPGQAPPMSGMGAMSAPVVAPRADAGMPGMDMPAPAAAGRFPIPGSTPVPHGPDTHGPGNSVIPMSTRSRLHEPGTGLGNDGRRVLLYTDLKALTAIRDRREPGREIELHLTGNMERFIWSFNGKKYSEAKEPIRFRYGERLRLTFVNDTMMEHPLHLHGMWMELENGSGQFAPRKHTVSVKPAERLSVAITADAPGRWAFHCHLLLHMEVGMFRVVEVSDRDAGGQG